MSERAVNARIAGWRVTTRRAARRCRHWERELRREDFVNGQFGENLTVRGLPDDEVCVGDRYRFASDPAGQANRGSGR